MDAHNTVTEQDSVPVELELEAMRQIGRALEMLKDADARRRVLQWTRDRFEPAARTAAPGLPVPVSGPPVLEIDELDDLFVPDTAHASAATPRVRAAAATATPARPAGVESMIRDFAADFRRFALEWQGA